MLDRYSMLEIIFYHKLVGTIYGVRFVYADCVFDGDLAFMNELREGWRIQNRERLVKILWALHRCTHNIDRLKYSAFKTMKWSKIGLVPFSSHPLTTYPYVSYVLDQAASCVI